MTACSLSNSFEVFKTRTAFWNALTKCSLFSGKMPPLRATQRQNFINFHTCSSFFIKQLTTTSLVPSDVRLIFFAVKLCCRQTEQRVIFSVGVCIRNDRVLLAVILRTSQSLQLLSFLLHRNSFRKLFHPQNLPILRVR